MANYRSLAERQAKRYFKSKRDRRRFVRQMGAEANFRDARSPAGAQGPAQIMPATARSWGVKNPHDPNEAYGAAAKHMAEYLKAYGGSWAKALTAYNAGPGRVGKSLPAETQNYIKKVLGGADAKAGALGEDMRSQTVELANKTEFDEKGFEQAQKRSLVGKLLAKRGGTDSPLFKTGLLSTEAPSAADFTSTRLVSRIKEGRAVAGSGSEGGGAAPGGALEKALAFDRHKTPYLWGGGHGRIAKPSERVDCSGFVSAVVGLKTPQVSGWFARNWGKPGVGKGLTVWANDGHVLVSMRDKNGKLRWFGTSRSNPGGGPGEIPAPSKSYLSRFTPRHK